MGNDVIKFQIINRSTGHTSAIVAIHHFFFHMLRDVPAHAGGEIGIDVEFVLSSNSDQNCFEFVHVWRKIDSASILNRTLYRERATNFLDINNFHWRILKIFRVRNKNHSFVGEDELALSLFAKLLAS